jgi:thiol-disulfide isomerase/thioredoxin
MRALLAFVLLTFMAAVSAEAPALKQWMRKGETPKLVGQDLSGKPQDLADHKGRVVVINFWATWCEPCIEEMPSLEKLRAKFEGKPFDIVAVNFGESNAKVADFVKKNNIVVPVVLDPDKTAANAWGAKGLPMTFIVDTKGKVRFWTFGEREWNEATTIGVIEKLLAEGAGA